MVIDVNLPPENPQQNFEEFFREYEDEPNHFKYRELIQQAAQTHEHVLYIYFEDLLSFDPALADLLKNEPEVALKHATESFKDVLRHYSGGQIDDGDYFVRVSTKNNSLMVKLRELRSSHIDKTVHIWGILIRASQIIPQITVATFLCPICQTQMEVEQIEVNNLISPARCANPSCNNKKGFTVVARDSQFIDWQSIKIQELQEELKPGRVPYGIKGILTHDLVDKARPGDRVKITGIYKIYPNENNKGKPTTLFTPYIKVLSIEGRNREEENLEISPEEMEEIKRWSKKKDIQKIIAKSLAPGIMGNDHLKMAACMSLFGGVKKEYENQATLRGDIHVLFVGDPGTGKSQILKQCSLVAPQSVFTSGRGSSAAGLTAGIVKESESGGMSLEAGALVLADGGVALIDEFDKMNKSDRVAIHEAMEQQSISIAKAGIIATLRARTSIIAAANPQFGRYDEKKSPTENIDLSSTILSRFDLIFVVRDTPNEEEDNKLAEFILKRHAQQIGDDTKSDTKTEELIPFNLLKKYIAYARDLTPKLTQEAMEEIKKFYVKVRSENKEKENKGGDVAVPLVARSLEGFIRISEAYAKMGLEPYVTAAHAIEALKLARKSIEDTSMDPVTGELNADRIFSNVSPGKKRVLKVLELLRKMIDANEGKPIKLDEFLEDASFDLKIEKHKVEELLKNMEEEGGVIYFPSQGYIGLIKKGKDKEAKK